MGSRLSKASSKSKFRADEDQGHSRISIDSLESFDPEDNPQFNSRQIILLGPEYLQKLSKTNVLIIGLQGLGVEIAKNLILYGPKKVTLFDKEIVTYRDLGSNYALRESQIGVLDRAKASEDVLQKLNDRVEVTASDTLDDLVILSQNLVIMTIFDADKITHISSLCHQNGIGFILTGLLGPLAFSFFDYGSEFKILDNDGILPKTFKITNITKQEQGVVTLAEPAAFLDEGYKLHFEEVEGMIELNNLNDGIEIVNKISDVSFEIGDTSKFSEYIGGGLASKFKEKFILNFKDFNESLANPDFHDWFNGCSRVEFSSLHKLFQSLFSFHSTHKSLPKTLDKSDYKTCKSIFSELFSMPVKSENTDFADIFKKTCLFSQIHLSALATFWGGIIAFDAFKYTGKYKPPFQWSYYDFSEYIQLDKARDFTEDRYYDERVLFGSEAIAKLQASKSFVIGAGALGCEIMKSYALMGVGTFETGKIHLTDDDNIEHSNLNRQFLYHKEDIGMSKSECAKNSTLLINPNCNIQHYTLRCNDYSRNTFDEIFWDSLDFIIPAVDTIESRNYVDSKATKYNLPIFNTGISGVSGNSEVFLPYLTNSYSDLGRYEDNAVWKPSCTLKYIPTKFENCIEWGRVVFQNIFIDEISSINRLLQNLDFYNEKTDKSTLESVFAAINTYKSDHFELCLKKKAVDKLKELSETEIIDLMKNFPVDHNENGVPFWQPPKTIPNPYQIPLNSRLGKKFIKSYVQIMSKIYNKIIQINDLSSKNIENFSAEISENPLQSIKDYCSCHEIPVFTPEEFDKDNDIHINFVYACAYIRASCFKIKKLGIYKTKEVAGDIAQTIASISAVATGVQMLELFKYASELPLESFRDSSFALIGDMMFFFPLNKPKTNEEKKKILERDGLKTIKLPKTSTSWDKQEINTQFTIKDFIDYFEDKVGVKTKFVYYDDSIVIYSDKYDKRAKERALKQTVEKRVEEVMEEEIKPGVKYIFLLIIGTFMDESVEKTVEICDEGAEITAGISDERVEKTAEIRNIKYFLTNGLDKEN